MTREPDIFKITYQEHIKGKADKYWMKLSVSTVIAK